MGIYSANLWVAAGTTVASVTTPFYNNLGQSKPIEWGLGLGDNASIFSQGNPTDQNHFVTAPCVQEQFNPLDMESYVSTSSGGQTELTPAPGFFFCSAPNTMPQADFLFSDFDAVSPYSCYYRPGDFGQEDPASDIAELSFKNRQMHGGFLGYLQTMLNPGEITLFNTVFDGTWIDFHPYNDGSGTAPSTLQANNNLFYGGELDLIPSATSTLNLMDNIFDQVYILEYWDPSETFNAAYNAFTPGTYRLIPMASTDQVLGSAMPYQTGPLGSFYVQPGTALDGHGSQTAALAGLYHFTTRVDQTKLAGSQVNIGPAFVACVNGAPIDTDGDGLPDYYEDANGNGVPDDATDWTQSITGSSGLPDGQRDSDQDGLNDQTEYALGTNPLNPKEDYDHDGLDNVMEAFLGTNPLVPDNCLSISGLNPNTPVSGTINVTVGINPRFQARDLALFADGKLAPGTQVMEGPVTASATFMVDTSRLQNGMRNFQPVATLQSTAGAAGPVLANTVEGPLSSAQVYNELSFAEITDDQGNVWQDEWSGTFLDTGMLITAYSSHFRFDYQITILDDQNNVVTTLPLQTSWGDGGPGDPVIDATWNLQDANNNTVSGTSYHASVQTWWPTQYDYNAASTGSGTATQSSPKSRLAMPWPNQVSWVVGSH